MSAFGTLPEMLAKKSTAPQRVGNTRISVLGSVKFSERQVGLAGAEAGRTIVVLLRRCRIPMGEHRTCQMWRCASMNRRGGRGRRPEEMGANGDSDCRSSRLGDRSCDPSLAHRSTVI